MNIYLKIARIMGVLLVATAMMLGGCARSVNYYTYDPKPAFLHIYVWDLGPFTVGERMHEVLPEATGGDLPVTYTLHHIVLDPDDRSAYPDYTRHPLPEGLTFDEITLVLGGTPTVAGSYRMEYLVTDADGDSVSVTFVLEIVNE